MTFASFVLFGFEVKGSLYVKASSFPEIGVMVCKENNVRWR